MSAIYAKMGKFDQAKKVSLEAISLFPREALNVRINLGHCYREEGDYENAEREYKYVLKYSPDNIKALYGLVLLYEETGDSETAAEMRQRYEKSLKSALGRSGVRVFER